MGMACSTCQHAEREAIDAAIVARQSMRSVARQFGLSKDSVARHRGHISAALVALAVEREAAGAVSLLDRVENLIRRCEGFLGAAERSGQVTQGLAAVRELRGLLELLGKASGELRETPSVTVNLMGSSEWLAVRGSLLAALVGHPAAREAVAGALLALGDGT